MEYKGHTIEDKCYGYKYSKLECYDYNSVEFKTDDLIRWQKALEAKEKELIASSEDFKDVQLVISANGDQYNPNGADEEPYMNINIQWQVAETELQKQHRIEKAKQRIDDEIAKEEAVKHQLEDKKQQEIDKAIRLLKSNGYNVI